MKNAGMIIAALAAAVGGFDAQAPRRSRSRYTRTRGAFGCSAFNRAKKKADAEKTAEAPIVGANGY